MKNILLALTVILLIASCGTDAGSGFTPEHIGTWYRNHPTSATWTGSTSLNVAGVRSSMADSSADSTSYPVYQIDSPKGYRIKLGTVRDYGLYMEVIDSTLKSPENDDINSSSNGEAAASTETTDNYTRTTFGIDRFFSCDSTYSANDNETISLSYYTLTNRDTLKVAVFNTGGLKKTAQELMCN